MAGIIFEVRAASADAELFALRAFYTPMSHGTDRSHSTARKSAFSLLFIGALGVVYGDIGTSPLYAVNEIFFGHGHVTPTMENVYGCISLVVWALTLIVAVKYIVFVLRADHDGEGGVFALLSLINKNKTHSTFVIISLLILAAGLLFGDGMITPAISVISAVEGLTIATPAFQQYVAPITILILTGLFAVQRWGTAKVGTVFGPIILVWFFAIAAMGLSNIFQNPGILHAFNPIHALRFMISHPIHQLFVVLGSVMLVVTGGEALYADMGHFGKKAIRWSWFSIAYPALILNYLGQGAFLLSGKTPVGGNIFYSMAPAWSLYPLVILATFATIIASQALISGGFSLAAQAVGLELFPRLRIVHTHKEHEGQIYVPFINWTLYAGCVLLVVIFKASTNLAVAYGLAVSGVMLVTSLGMFYVARQYWKWSLAKIVALFGFFAVIDASFLIANSLKFLEGGFVPLGIGVSLFFLMTTWQWGRKRIAEALRSYPTLTVERMIALKSEAENQVPRSVVIMTPHAVISKDDHIPPLLQIIWERFQVLPKDILFLNVQMGKEPYTHENRYEVTRLQDANGKGTVHSVVFNFGFMEDPNVEAILEDLAKHHEVNIDENPKNWIVYILQEKVIPGQQMSFAQWFRFKAFQILVQNSKSADEYFGLGRDIGLSTEMIPVTLK